MTLPPPARRRFDAPTLEMIVVVMLTTLHDFLLSDVLSLPLALKRGTLAQLRSLDQLASSLELVVPVAIFAIMFILWLLGRNAWVRRVAMFFLAWVTLRLIAKISPILTTPAHDAGAWVIVSRPQTGVGVLLRDTVVLWFVTLAPALHPAPQYAGRGVQVSSCCSASGIGSSTAAAPTRAAMAAFGALIFISRSAAPALKAGPVGGPACGTTCSWGSAAARSSA
jgi:hypothetical protein